VYDKYPNSEQGRRLEGLICIRKEAKHVKRRDQACYVFRHDDFPDQELYCVTTWSRVTQEGSSTQFLEAVQIEAQEDDPDDDPEELPQDIRRRAVNGGMARAEDIAAVRAAGFEVDDDNDAAPENLPALAAAPVPPPEQVWGDTGLCHRRKENLQETKGKLNGVSDEIVRGSFTVLSMFLLFLPRVFIEEVLLV